VNHVHVAKGSGITNADAAGGISRRTAVDEPTLWAGIATVPAGASTGWHHHGTNTTVFSMLSGTLTVEHGDDESSEATTGGLRGSSGRCRAQRNRQQQC